MNATEASMTLRGRTPTSVASARRSALVIGTVIVGTVAFAEPVWFVDNDFSDGLLVAGPPLLGALAALVAGGQARLLGIAAATFLVIGTIAFIWQEWGPAEAGIFVVIVAMAEIVALYVTAGVWWIVSRLIR
jgi:hypothetical protein